MILASLSVPGFTRSTPEAEPSRPTELSLRELFEENYASIFRLLRRLGVEQGSVEDAAQEVFWVAARRRATILAGKEHAFLYGVALRVAADQRKKRNVLAGIEPDALAQVPDARPSPEEIVDQKRSRALLDRVLDAMTPDTRSVFVFAVLEELPLKEIAEIEGVPLGTATSRLRRAREEFSTLAKRLRASLGTKGLGG